MLKLGLIVNPIAGLGGRVGLKGTDGPEVVRRALQLGARPRAGSRAIQALERLRAHSEGIEILTYPGEMGENQARACGFSPVVLGRTRGSQTRAADTQDAAARILDNSADLLLFAGGDGTARDILEAVADRMVVVGIPAGVKMHSGVYAPHPARAGELAGLYLAGEISRVQEVEIMDIDEEAYRRGRVSASLHGYLRTPCDTRYRQVSKMGSPPSEEAVCEAIALEVVEHMREACTYLVGPGSTTRAILQKLGLEGTLLGVDVVRDTRLIGRDLGEDQLLAHTTGGSCRLILSPIGGQGFLVGRGNQQLSPAVIQRIGLEGLIVVASGQKLNALRGSPLLVDTGEPEVDQMLSGYVSVTTGYRERVVYPVAF